MGRKGIPTGVANPARRLLNLCNLVEVTTKNTNVHLDKFMAAPFGEAPGSSRIAVLLIATVDTINECEKILTRIMGESRSGHLISWCEPMRNVLSPLSQANAGAFKATLDQHRRVIDIAADFIDKALLETDLLIYEGTRDDWTKEIDTLIEEIQAWKKSISDLELSPVTRTIVFSALTKLEQSLSDSWITGPQGLQEAYFYANGVTEAYKDELGDDATAKMFEILSRFNTVCDAAKNIFVIGATATALLLTN